MVKTSALARNRLGQVFLFYPMIQEYIVYIFVLLISSNKFYILIINSVIQTIKNKISLFLLLCYFWRFTSLTLYFWYI